METRKLIESGDLELYVIGTLPQAERQAIDALRATDAEVNAEILNIEIALEKLALQSSHRLNQDVKRKIKEGLDFQSIPNQNQAKVVPVNTSLLRYAVAASVSIAIISTTAAICFYSQWNSTNQTLQALLQEQTVLANKASYFENSFDSLQRQHNILINPSNKQIALNPLPFAPQAKAVVYYDASNGAVYFNPSLMPSIAENQQYQLWAIVEGKPVDLGVVEKNTRALLQMKTVKNPAAFAVTLEPLGGSPTPTLENMCVIGNV